MATVKYLGPGESVTVDGVEIKKGETAYLDPGQVMRIRMDPDAEIEVSDEADTPVERERARDWQDERRDSQANERATATTATKTKRGKTARKE